MIQPYETDVAKEYVILGNDALMKCSIPSFVADSLVVTSWLDNEGNEFPYGGSNQGNFGQT